MLKWHCGGRFFCVQTEAQERGGGGIMAYKERNGGRWISGRKRSERRRRGLKSGKAEVWALKERGKTGEKYEKGGKNGRQDSWKTGAAGICLMSRK